VILRGVSAEELDAKVAKLRAYSSKYPNLSFAIGRHVEEDEKDIRTALRLADQNMYADKRKFYEEHPERTRRLQ
jgi:recombinational DNA repair protein RecT